MKSHTKIKTLALALLLAATAVSVEAQTIAMRDAFRQMPDSIFHYLSQNNRLDMIDFVDSNMEARITNKLDGQSTLDTLTADYLRLTLTPATSVEMKLLAAKDALPDSTTQVVCVVENLGERHNVCAVSFYTAAWQPVDCGNPLSDAVPTDPTTDPVMLSTTTGAALTATRAHLNADDATIAVDLTYTFFADEMGNKPAPVVRTITLRWDGKRFVSE